MKKYFIALQNNKGSKSKISYITLAQLAYIIQNIEEYNFSGTRENTFRESKLAFEKGTEIFQRFKAQLPLLHIGQIYISISSGYLYIDIDKKSNNERFSFEEAIEIKQKIIEELKHKGLALASISSSGKGILLIIKLSHRISKEAYKEIWKNLTEQLETKFNIICDTSSSSIKQGTFLPYDANVYENETVEPYQINQQQTKKTISLSTKIPSVKEWKEMFNNDYFGFFPKGFITAKVQRKVKRTTRRKTLLVIQNILYFVNANLLKTKIESDIEDEIKHELRKFAKNFKDTNFNKTDLLPPEQLKSIIDISEEHKLKLMNNIDNRIEKQFFKISPHALIDIKQIDELIRIQKPNGIKTSTSIMKTLSTSFENINYLQEIKNAYETLKKDKQKITIEAIANKIGKNKRTLETFLQRNQTSIKNIQNLTIPSIEQKLINASNEYNKSVQWFTKQTPNFISFLQAESVKLNAESQINKPIH